MSIPNTLVLGQTFEFTTQAQNGSGVPVDADALPTYSIYEDGTDTAIATGTMAKLDDTNTTGLYRGSVSATTANGYERFKSYNTYISAVISGTTYTMEGTTLCMGDEDTFSATTGALTTLTNFKSFAGITTTDNDTLITALINRSTSAIQKFTGRLLISDTYREIKNWDGSSDIMVDEYPITAVTLLSTSRDAAFSIKNTSGDAYNAYIQITSTEISLVVEGGTNAGSETITLASYATLTLLQAAITALAVSWEMTTLTTDFAKWSPTELLPVSGLRCLDAYTEVEVPGEPDGRFVIDEDAGIINGASFWNFNYNWNRSAKQSLIIKYTGGYVTTPADLEQICIDLTKVYYDGRKSDSNLVSEKIGDYSYKKGDIDTGNMPLSIQTRLSVYKRQAL